EIEVYLQDDVTDENMNLIEEKVNENEGISSITFRSKNEALELMRDDWEDNAYLLDGLEEENTLPNSYIIQLEDIKYADQVVHVLNDMDGIEKIDYHKEIIDKLAVFSNYIRVGGIALIAALIFVSIFIISNTIKLTVSARKREINIMKYVGATNGYIKGPFIMEGILFGLLGAVISIVVVYFGYEYFFNTVSQKVYAFFTIFTMGLVPPAAILNDIVIIFIAIGTGIGALGSLVSMRRYLNVYEHKDEMEKHKKYYITNHSLYAIFKCSTSLCK